MIFCGREGGGGIFLNGQKNPIQKKYERNLVRTNISLSLFYKLRYFQRFHNIKILWKYIHLTDLSWMNWVSSLTSMLAELNFSLVGLSRTPGTIKQKDEAAAVEFPALQGMLLLFTPYCSLINFRMSIVAFPLELSTL